jgi:hypothetical protein
MSIGSKGVLLRLAISLSASLALNSGSLAEPTDALVESLAKNVENSLKTPFPGQCAVTLLEKEFQGDQISFDKDLAAEIVALKTLAL